MNIVEQMPYENMVKWREHLHANPELSFEEFKTTEYLIEILSKFSNISLEKVAETGVVVTLEGAKPGPTIALRADIDALPVQEATDLAYKSQTDGIMHACGHDVHTASLLGAVEVLSGMQDKLSGKIKFLFQAAEEAPPGGARFLVDHGVLDGVDLVFGLHVFPMCPVGVIGTKEGPVTAASDTVDILVKGKGAHGSMPNLSIDPIMIATSIIDNINNIVSRNIDPYDNVVISVGRVQAGQAHNVIPETAEISLTVRTNRPETRTLVKRRLELITKNVCEMWDADFEFTYKEGYSAVQNDAKATKIVLEAGEKVVGKDHILDIKPMMGGEDFSAYTDAIPGAFFLLGGGSAEDGYAYINHNPKFCIDNRCLRYGAAMEVAIALECLGEK